MRTLPFMGPSTCTTHKHIETKICIHPHRLVGASCAKRICMYKATITRAYRVKRAGRSNCYCHTVQARFALPVEYQSKSSSPFCSACDLVMSLFGAHSLSESSQIADVNPNSNVQARRPPFPLKTTVSTTEDERNQIEPIWQ